MGDAMLIPGQSYGQATLYSLSPDCLKVNYRNQQINRSFLKPAFYCSGEVGHYIATVAETEILERQMSGEFRLRIIIH